MKCKKKDLQDLVCEDTVDLNDGSVLKKEHKERGDDSRWQAHYEYIFRLERQDDPVRYFRTHYTEGLTEYQDERPFEYGPDEIECEEVVPVEKQVTVIEWQTVREAAQEAALDVLYPREVEDAQDA